MKEQIPLYSYSGEYAYEHGELKQFHASYQANVACKEAIEQAISDHYGNNRLDASCVDQVVDRCNPGLTDLFITIARKNHALEQEKKPSVRDSLKRNNGRQEHKAKPKVHGGPER